MGKFLRVLVVFFLIFSIGALVLGILLFGRRELLKGRTQALETALMELAPSIEAEPGVVEETPVYPERDISPVSFEIPEELEYNEFWPDYDHNLEVQEAISIVNLKDKQKRLMTYYQIHPATGERIKDEISGVYMTTGPGTMNELIEDVNEKSFAQLELLNTTRQQLSDIRAELIDCIEKLNAEKAAHRDTHVISEQRRLKIIELEARIDELEAQVAELEEQIEALNAEIAEKDTQIVELEESLGEAERQVADLKAQLQATVKAANAGTAQLEGEQDGASAPVNPIEPGTKGTVVQVNTEWEFIVIEMNDTFIREVLGDDEPGGSIFGVELWVHRPDDKKTFVAKVRLNHVNRQKKLGTASIMDDWLQMPIKVGDQLQF